MLLRIMKHHTHTHTPHSSRDNISAIRRRKQRLVNKEERIVSKEGKEVEVSQQIEFL